MSLSINDWSDPEKLHQGPLIPFSFHLSLVYAAQTMVGNSKFCLYYFDVFVDSMPPLVKLVGEPTAEKPSIFLDIFSFYHLHKRSVSNMLLLIIITLGWSEFIPLANSNFKILKLIITSN